MSLHRRAGRVSNWLLVATVVATGACNTLDSLVAVDPPDRIASDVFEVPANAGTLVNGAIGDFECALASTIVGAGLTSDELTITGTNVQWYSYDRRAFATSGLLGAGFAISTCATQVENSVGVYRPLSTSRYTNDNTTALLERWTDAEVPNRAGLIATASAHAAYSLLLLGETMCSAAIDLGPELTPAQIFAEAEARFSKAITNAQGATNASIMNLALVGRARTRLNLGRAADAAVDARLVPAGYVRNATYSESTLRRYNFLQYHNRRDVVVIEEPYRVRTYQGVQDPRVKVSNTGRIAPQSGMPIWYEEKYPLRASPMPIARTNEARLIVAEAALTTNLQEAIDIINTLHTQAGAGFPGYTGGTAAEVKDQLIYERSAELFLEGQRLMDIKRYSLPLLPAPGSAYHLGGVYGNETCYPLPDVERNNNPNLN